MTGAFLWHAFILSAKKRRARKEHICGWCKKPILKGETYVEIKEVCYRHSGWGKEYHTDRYHTKCFLEMYETEGWDNPALLKELGLDGGRVS